MPFVEKKLDFSPVWVTKKVPRRKSTGTATKRRVAAAPKLVVSIETNGYSQKLSLSGPIKLIHVRALHRALQERPIQKVIFVAFISRKSQSARQLRRLEHPIDEKMFISLKRHL